MELLNFLKKRDKVLLADSASGDRRVQVFLEKTGRKEYEIVFRHLHRRKWMWHEIGVFALSDKHERDKLEVVASKAAMQKMEQLA